jgi:D-3-phosphoglycerate dehydrogenase
VAELTIGLMLSLLRGVQIANLGMHQGKWSRYMGRRIPEVTIGLVGVGRIGQRVLQRLESFGPSRILVNDLNPIPDLLPELKLEWVGKEELYSQADIISLHVPLTPATKNLVQADQLAMMKSDALIVNTARGGIVNETDLYEALVGESLGGAAIDVFMDEPYEGPLAGVNRCLLTCHMGSMSQDCRSQMEIEATEEAVLFLKRNEQSRPVPESEYLLQAT